MVALDSTALLSHILSQTKQNVQFLMDQNQISAAEGRDILAKLPTSPSPVQDITQATQRLNFNLNGPTAQPVLSPLSYNAQAHKATVPPPPPPQQSPHLFQAKALWDYNADPNDLSFRSGDVIDVVEETNSDWWTGRLNGRQALFPSNYVEKLAPYTSPASNPLNGALYSEKSNYSTPHYVPPPSAPMQPYSGYHAPQPPNPSGYNTHAAPAPPAPPPATEEPKKGKLGGKLGNTFAHSAVGGLGLGAGSAIGSGIIHSIF